MSERILFCQTEAKHVQVPIFLETNERPLDKQACPVEWSRGPPSSSLNQGLPYKKEEALLVHIAEDLSNVSCEHSTVTTKALSLFSLKSPNPATFQKEL